MRQQEAQEAPGDTQEAPGDTQEAPGGTQEAPRRHPGGTRRHPGGTQEEAPRRHPGGQEAPRRPEATWRLGGSFCIVKMGSKSNGRPFRVDETSASVTVVRYLHDFSVDARTPARRCTNHRPKKPPGPLQCKHCLGNIKNIQICLHIFPIYVHISSI